MSLGLGFAEWRNDPASWHYRLEAVSGVGFWLIGLLVGIDLILNGWAWIMLAFAAWGNPSRRKAEPSSSRFLDAIVQPKPRSRNAETDLLSNCSPAAQFPPRLPDNWIAANPQHRVTQRVAESINAAERKRRRQAERRNSIRPRLIQSPGPMANPLPDIVATVTHTAHP